MYYLARCDAGQFGCPDRLALRPTKFLSLFVHQTITKHGPARPSRDAVQIIAGTLFLAEGTVKNHVTNILGKLEVRDRTQAALKAKECSLI